MVLYKNWKNFYLLRSKSNTIQTKIRKYSVYWLYTINLYTDSEWWNSAEMTHKNNRHCQEQGPQSWQRTGGLKLRHCYCTNQKTCKMDSKYLYLDWYNLNVKQNLRTLLCSVALVVVWPITKNNQKGGQNKGKMGRKRLMRNNNMTIK